jgi:hypothetical protein
MTRISFAFRCFFSLLFRGVLPADIAQSFGYAKAVPMKAATPKAAPKPDPKPAVKPHAAPAPTRELQSLAILQRDARLVDFLMEDISAYSDDQVGAAVREVQIKARQSLQSSFLLQPAIDGVEGDFIKLEGLDPASFRLVGKVPPDGKAPGGLLRHKGWKTSGALIAPAELEVE